MRKPAPVLGRADVSAVGSSAAAAELCARNRCGPPTRTTRVALLRAPAGRDPYGRRLTDLIGELATRSEDFRVRWASHDVRTYVTGVKRIHHPLVGDLELPFETSPVGADRASISSSTPPSRTPDRTRP